MLKAWITTHNVDLIIPAKSEANFKWKWWKSIKSSVQIAAETVAYSINLPVLCFWYSLPLTTTWNLCDLHSMRWLQAVQRLCYIPHKVLAHLFFLAIPTVTSWLQVELDSTSPNLHHLYLAFCFEASVVMAGTPMGACSVILVHAHFGSLNRRKEVEISCKHLTNGKWQ